jgi:hypothetical protein
MADGEAFDLNAPPPGVLETLDAVRREDEVEVEGRLYPSQSGRFSSHQRR